MAKTTETKTETTTFDPKSVTRALRTGTRAYLGLYGTAFARTKMRFEQVKASTDGLFDTLVQRGEVIEGQALNTLKTAQTKVTTGFEANAAKVREILPTASNDRVEALEAEIAALNTKIAKMAKTSKAKAQKSAPKASLKTDKVTKAA